MRNIRLIIEYDGTNYLGWQRQPQGATVQQVIEEAIFKITGEAATLFGSGRTDSGVHAIAQAANFRTESLIAAVNIEMGLNSILPDDISIARAEEVSANFHAQFDARSKTYLYRILNRGNRSALLRRRVWQIPHALDVAKMAEAAEILLGEHDFRVFALAGWGVRTTARTVLRADFERVEDEIRFEIEATGFLKGMVRLIVGTLAQVGRGRITPEDFHRILDLGAKTKHVHSAPARGLYLKEVKY
ncbi:MAG: tRNA pseudouridine(38-40) synthase TruA [Deltaproteobacteria bacterium]